MSVYPLSRWPAARVSLIVDPPVYALLAADAVMNLGAFVPVAPLRACTALPLALIAPGYAILAALRGRRPLLDAPLLLALGVLLSMAFYPLLALALYGIGLSLSTGSVLTATDAVVVTLALVSALRARPAPSGSSTASASVRGVKASRGRVLALGATVLLVCAGVAASQAAHLFTTSGSTAAPYTEFYLSGPWVHLDRIVHVAPRQRLRVEVGIVNRTHRRQRYRLSPLLDGAHWRWRMITLDAGGAWTGAVEGATPKGGCLHRLNITLHAGDSRLPMKPLILWVQVGRVLPATCQRRG